MTSPERGRRRTRMVGRETGFRNSSSPIRRVSRRSLFGRGGSQAPPIGRGRGRDEPEGGDETEGGGRGRDEPEGGDETEGGGSQTPPIGRAGEIELEGGGSQTPLIGRVEDAGEYEIELELGVVGKVGGGFGGGGGGGSGGGGGGDLKKALDDARNYLINSELCGFKYANLMKVVIEIMQSDLPTEHNKLKIVGHLGLYKVTRSEFVGRMLNFFKDWFPNIAYSVEDGIECLYFDPPTDADFCRQSWNEVIELTGLLKLQGA